MNFLKRIFNKSENEEAPITSEAEFWQWFTAHEKQFYNIVKSGEGIPEDFIKPVQAKLGQLRPDCYFLLTGMYEETGAELVFSVDGVAKNVVFVDELVVSAPELDNWKFTPLRPAIDFKDRGIKLGEIEFTAAKIKFYPLETDGYPDLISLKITHEDFTTQDESLITNGVYIYMDHILGERNFLTTVDEFEVVDASSIQEELVPIEKINDYLNWRQKEFIEKYEGKRKDTEADEYVVYEAELQSGNRGIATFNKDLLTWDSKASHPWILVVKAEYDTKRSDGLPDDKIAAELNALEDLFMAELKDEKAYLNIGRESGDWLRETYFACKEFSWCSKKVDEIIRAYEGPVKLEYEIYKDKYWKSFEKYNVV